MLVRKTTHIAMAALPLAGWLISYRIALVGAILLVVGSVIVEVARHRSPALNRLLWDLLPTVFRPWEGRRILGSTWFSLGALIALLAFGRDIGGLAILFLAWGDSAAEIAGRRWGTAGQRKTLAGSAACLAACLLGAAVAVALSDASPRFLPWVPAQPPAGLGSWPALAGALAATAVERWSPPPDDNLWIPVLSGLVTAAASAALTT